MDLSKVEKAAYDKAHYAKPEVKAARKARSARPEVKAAIRASIRAIQITPAGKAAMKATHKVWATTKEGKASILKSRCKNACTTPEHYNSLPKKCSFPECTAAIAGGNGDWHMDHDKVARKFRGLLCFKHNRQVGDLTLDDVRRKEMYLMRSDKQGV